MSYLRVVTNVFRSHYLDPTTGIIDFSKSISSAFCLFIAGLEEQFDKVKFPTGKVAVDGFICTFDVSRSQTRTLESQLDFVNKILSMLVKTKKPVVVAATKMDEGSEAVLLVSSYLLIRSDSV